MLPMVPEDCLRVHRQSQTEGRKDARANMESLPHLKQPRVRINAESVFENLAYEAKAGHPIEEVQRKMPQTEFQAKVAHRARVFGPAAALHLHMDRAIMSRKQRLPGLPSRLVALETVLGKDETIQFEDYLGNPDISIDMNQRSVHDLISYTLDGEGV